MTTRLEYPKFQAFDTNGDPLSGGLVYTYEVGTDTLKTTYSDYAGTTPNANPVVLDSRGEADIHVNGAYKVVLKTSAGVTLWTLAYVQGGLGDESIGSNFYYPDATATDQGITGSSNTIKYAVDTIGSDKGTIYLSHDSGDATTTYTLTTAAQIPENIDLVFEKGAIIAVTGTLTINGTIQAGRCQIFSGSGIVTSNPNIDAIYPEWFGAVANDEDVAAANYTAIQQALKMAFCHPYSADTGAPLYNQSHLSFSSGDWWITGNSPLCLTRTQIEALPSAYRYRTGLKISGTGRNSTVLILKNTGAETWMYSNYDAAYAGAMSAVESVTFEGITFRSEDFYYGYGTTQRRWPTSSDNDKINGFYFESTGWEKFMLFNECNFQGFDKCIYQTGTANADHNTYTNCGFYSIIDYVFYCKNDQSVQNRFFNCDMILIHGSIFKIRPNGGGDLTMQGGSVLLMPVYKSNDLPLIGSETELMTTQADRDFSGANSWANNDLGGAFNASGDLTITATVIGQYCYLPALNAPTTAGKRYRLRYDCANIVGAWDVYDVTGTAFYGRIQANATQGYLEWTAQTSGGIAFIAIAANSSGDFDNFRLYEVTRRAFLDVDMEDALTTTGLGRGNDKFRFKGIRFEVYDALQLYALIKRNDDASVGHSVSATFEDCTCILDSYYDAADDWYLSTDSREVVAIEQDIGGTVKFIRCHLDEHHQYSIYNTTSLYAQSRIDFVDCLAFWDPEEGTIGGSLRSRCLNYDSTMGLFTASGCSYVYASPSAAATRHVLDFTYGYARKNATNSTPLKLANVKADDGAWPSSTVSDKVLYMPEGSIVTGVVMYKPDPGVGTGNNYDLQLQDYEANVLWSTGADAEQTAYYKDEALTAFFTIPAAPNNYVFITYDGTSNAAHGTTGFFIVKYI